ncbi:MAG: mechanosensitive ion channel family protein [Burkholderiales bacterium]
MTAFRPLHFLLVLLLAVVAFGAAGAEPPAAQEAVVSVYHRPVAVFRAPFLGLSPQERARRAEESIRDTLAHGGPGEVTVQQEPQGRVILIDGALTMILIPQDADPLRRESLDQATRATVAALQRAIAETGEARDRGRLLRAVAWSLGATVVYVVLWGVVLWLRAFLNHHSSEWVEAAGLRVRVAQTALWQPARVRRVIQMAVRFFSWIVLAALTYQWLVFVMKRFPFTRAAGEQLGAFVIGVGERVGGGVLESLPDLAVAVVIFALARAVTGMLKPAFERAEHGVAGGGWIDRDNARPTRRIVNVAIWLFALVMAYPYLPGSQTEAFKGVSVLVGLVVTLGGSSLFGHAASGMILMYSRTLRVGEYVRVDGIEGTVVEMGTFTTRVRTGMGEEVTLPNSVLMATTICNYSRPAQGPGYMVDTAVTIGYDTPWRAVESMLIEAAHRTPGVLADPAPRVLQRSLSDFYIEYRLVCQASPETPIARAELLNTLHASIVDVFNEHGVQIMSPHYLGDPEQPKVVPPTHARAAPVARKG